MRQRQGGDGDPPQGGMQLNPPAPSASSRRWHGAYEISIQICRSQPPLHPPTRPRAFRRGRQDGFQFALGTLQIASKTGLKTRSKLRAFSKASWARFRRHFGPQDGPQIEPKTLPRGPRKRDAEKLIFDQPSHVFGRFWPPTWPRKSLQIVLETSSKTASNINSVLEPKMVPKRPPGPPQNGPKSAPRRTPND